MSESLKPCPKCGHENVVGFVYGRAGTFYGIEVRCECGLRFNADTMCDDEEEAWNAGAHMWNDRHELTCESIYITFNLYECSNTGKLLGSNDISGDYCKHCSGRILKEENDG